MGWRTTLHIHTSVNFTFWLFADERVKCHRSAKPKADEQKDLSSFPCKVAEKDFRLSRAPLWVAAMQKPVGLRVCGRALRLYF